MKYGKISGFSDEIASDIITQFEVLNRLGIEYFEPRNVNGKNISELNDDEVMSLKDAMAKYKIKVSSVGSPIGKIRLDEDFDKHFEVFKRTVKTAKTLESKYIRIFSFYHKGGEWSSEERSEILRRLRMMISYAEDNDVILLHENEKDIYGDIAGRCADLMSELYCEHFKAVFDPANFVQCAQDTLRAYECLKDYVEYLHIKDALLADGRVVPAGMGDGNLQYIVTDFINSGRGGFLSLEPHLGSFEGLAALELGDKMLGLPKSGEGTFTIAFNALNEIIEKI
ncbi:MAG: TIM barrel protein [Clostridiales bacterium]|nr:TIM barrel protein [Clostridiales bacterium]